MKKRTMYAEAAYLLGMAILALGTALMERADFGMSMVVAPAYLVHLKVSAMDGWGFFSFGMAEYLLQFALLAVLSLSMRRVRISNLFSFVTAVLYGIMLDAAIWLVGCMPLDGIYMRVIEYLVGMAACSLGVAMLFHTYLPPEAYELVVKEISAARGWKVSAVKTVYDCISCAVAVGLSFAFFGFGRFEGVKWGTILCALVNGRLIGGMGRWLEKRWDFADCLPLRRYFA